MRKSIKTILMFVIINAISFLCVTMYAFPSFMVKEGFASWYWEGSPGIRRTTANMEVFDDKDMTCAMWDVPFDSLIEVTNLRNNKKVIVRVNDRGPAKRLCEKGRIIDLTRAAFRKIEDPEKGLARVKIRIERI